MSAPAADTRAGDEPPAAYLQRVLSGELEFAFAIIAATQLGIADCLQDDPRSIDDLAARTSTHAPSLRRLMRALASRGVFVEDRDGRFSLTELGQPLRTDAPESMRPQALWTGSEEFLRTWAALAHSVRTGESAFAHLHGKPFFSHLGEQPEFARLFNDVMTRASEADDIRSIVDSYDFGRFHKVVDVGGGHGSLLKLMLDRYPNLTGVLYDIPEVVAGTHESFDQLVTRGRARKIGGDFFESVPHGGDAYVLKFIVHDWDDDSATRILHNCRDAMREHAKVLIIEIVLPSGNTSPDASFLDLTMLLFTSGRERTEAEYAELLRRAGLQLTGVTRTGSTFSVIEAVRS
jgi:O-methyltransferase domain